MDVAQSSLTRFHFVVGRHDRLNPQPKADTSDEMNLSLAENTSPQKSPLTVTGPVGF